MNELLIAAQDTISTALLAHGVSALVVIIPGSGGKLYGTATILDDMNEGIAAMGLVDGVTVRTPHHRLGLVTFDYVPARAQA